MKKGGIVCLIIALVLTVAGLVMCAVGLALGGNARINGESVWAAFPFIRHTTQVVTTEVTPVEEYFRVQNFPDEQLVDFELDVEGVEVEVKQGESFDIVAESADWYSEVENGIWSMQVTPNGANGKLTLTIPQGFAVQQLQLNAGGSDVTLQGINTQSLVVQLGAGKAQLTDFTCTTYAEFNVGAGKLEYTGTLEAGATIDCGAGKVEIETPQPESYGYAVNVGMGSVEIGGESFDGVKDVTRHEDARPFYTVNCGMGKVSIDFAHE